MSFWIYVNFFLPLWNTRPAKFFILLDVPLERCVVLLLTFELLFSGLIVIVCSLSEVVIGLIGVAMI